MNIRVWVKRKFADRALAPVRNEIIDLIGAGSSLLEVGCGTGDLLFKSTPKISHGLGVDIDVKMIAFANSRVQKEKTNNLEFLCTDLRNLEIEQFDIATATLCLHELPEQSALEVLESMINRSSKVIIADFTSPGTFLGNVSIELDEFFSGHYLNYRSYKKNGEIPYYANQLGASVLAVQHSSVDGIAIWTILDKRSSCGHAVLR